MNKYPFSLDIPVYSWTRILASFLFNTSYSFFMCLSGIAAFIFFMYFFIPAGIIFYWLSIFLAVVLAVVTAFGDSSLGLLSFSVAAFVFYLVFLSSSVFSVVFWIYYILIVLFWLYRILAAPYIWASILYPDYYLGLAIACAAARLFVTMVIILCQYAAANIRIFRIFFIADNFVIIIFCFLSISSVSPNVAWSSGGRSVIWITPPMPTLPPLFEALVVAIILWISASLFSASFFFIILIEILCCHGAIVYGAIVSISPVSPASIIFASFCSGETNLLKLFISSFFIGLLAGNVFLLNYILIAFSLCLSSTGFRLASNSAIILNIILNAPTTACAPILYIFSIAAVSFVPLACIHIGDA